MAKKSAKPTRKRVSKRRATLGDMACQLQGIAWTLAAFQEVPEPIAAAPHLERIGKILEAVADEVESFGGDEEVPGNQKYSGRGCYWC